MEIVTGQANIDLIEEVFKEELDWDLIADEKQKVLDAYDRLAAREEGFKKHRKCNNAQRPKPRKKKRKNGTKNRR